MTHMFRAAIGGAGAPKTSPRVRILARDDRATLRAGKEIPCFAHALPMEGPTFREFLLFAAFMVFKNCRGQQLLQATAVFFAVELSPTDKAGRWSVRITITAMGIFAITIASAWSADRTGRDHAIRRTAHDLCTVEVLHSEELPGAPTYHNLVRARLRVRPPVAPPFEVTRIELITSQESPLRRGQRFKLGCESALVQPPIPSWGFLPFNVPRHDQSR